jgi:hypothetical protein
MKIWKLVLAVSLVATWGLMSAVGAKADGLPPDPHFQVNQCPVGSTNPACDATTITVVGDVGEVSEVYSTTTIAEPFINNADNAVDLLALVVTITGAPLVPQGYNCTSNVFADCQIVSPPVCTTSCTLTVNFDELDLGNPAVDKPDTSDPNPAGAPAGLSDAIFCNNSGQPGVLTDCPGYIAVDQVVSVAIVSPEPSTILLLAAGLIPLLGFGRKRWNAAR